MEQNESWQKEKKRLLVVVMVCFLLGMGGQYYFLGPESKVISRFHRTFVEDHARTTWHLNEWLGVRSLVNPMDAWIFQEIVSEIKPDIIIETGTYEGGGALFLASILDHVNPEGKVITIDIEDRQYEAAKMPLYQKYVKFYLSSSTDENTVNEIRSQIDGKKVMVILDSYHGKDHVKNEMDLYGPMVSKGSYMIVTDTHLNGHPTSDVIFDEEGPMEALEEWLPNHPEFTSDESRERLLFTWHPKGYLRKE